MMCLAPVCVNMGQTDDENLYVLAMWIFLIGTDEQLYVPYLHVIIVRVIRAEAENCFLQQNKKFTDVTFVLGDDLFFCAHRGSKIQN